MARNAQGGQTETKSSRAVRRERGRAGIATSLTLVVFAALSLGGGAAYVYFGLPVSDSARIEASSRATKPAAAFSAEAGPEGAIPNGVLGPEGDLLSKASGSEPARLTVTTGRIPSGGSLGSALTDEGIRPAAVSEVTKAMAEVFDFRSAQPGDFFALVEDDNQRVISFEFQRGRSTIYRVARNDVGNLVARSAEMPLERRVAQLGGVVQASLFESILEQGERPDLVQAFADIFIWDFDFSTQARPGDEFRMVFEKFYDRDGFVRYGDILAAQYLNAEQELTAVYFEDDNGYGDYYTPGGHSVRRSFLRAPLTYSRISSGFSKARLHPVLHVERPHEGIDYAAPIGTPVWAVSEGRVIFQGWSGGFGRLVKVKHGNGYVSYYGHLSRFAPNLAVGARVRQKQVIGFVGRSGLATGPHLDYRLQFRGKFVNPLKARFPNGSPIPVEARERFDATRNGLLAELRRANPALVLEAAM
jgi:murein DD-endopeptidase MepM/ murein hydrolase activator NlpD